MTRPEAVVVVRDDDEAFAIVAAGVMAVRIQEALTGRGRCAIALAGGSTPAGTYRELGRRADIPWDAVHVHFGDERCVAADDPASNHALAAATLLAAPIPAENVHRMRGEDADRERAARQAAAELPEALDLLVLGLGEDGHVASLFPGSSALSETERLVVPVTGPKPPPDRLTITPPVIERARRLLVLARGAGKAAALASALADAGDARQTPARLAIRGTFVIDEALARALPGALSSLHSEAVPAPTEPPAG